MPFKFPIHQPRLEVIIWACCTFPFTVGNTAYIFLRPHSLPGHKWHDPIFHPIAQWAAIDHLYGEQGWIQHEGFTAAQGVINMLEVMMLMTYAFIVHFNAWGGIFRERPIGGKWAARAMVVGFGTGVVTATKTALYCMNVSPSITLWLS